MILKYVIIVLGIMVLGVFGLARKLDCKLLGDKVPTLKLKRHLFCEYDATVRPVTAKDRSVNVTISLSPKFMDFIDRTGTFILHAWLFISWKDEHLTWTPADFDGLLNLRVTSDDVWVPDFSIYNSGDMEHTQTTLPSTICQITYTGTVVCIPSIKFNAQCDTDYTYWPYDTQQCQLRMGSWTHTGEELSLNFRKKPVNMISYVEHKQWLITNYTTRKYNPVYSCCPNDTFPSLIVTFDMERHTSMIRAVFITPAIVLMVLTITVLRLDSRSIERISLGAVNFVCHLLCIYYLHWMLPINGAKPPHILLFYRDSLIIATFAMIITSLLRKIQSTKVSAPDWVISSVTLVANNPAGRFLLLDNSEASVKELSAAEVDNEENTEGTVGYVASTRNHREDDTWRKLSLIIEWLAFILSTFTYVLLIFLLVPMSDYGPGVVQYTV